MMLVKCDTFGPRFGGGPLRSLFFIFSAAFLCSGPDAAADVLYSVTPLATGEGFFAHGTGAGINNEG